MTHTETHSPLPWKYSEGYHVIVDAKGYFLGTLANSEDNALAIRSVNALPSLVEALEMALEFINDARTVEIIYAPDHDIGLAASRSLASLHVEHALALAKGE